MRNGRVVENGGYHVRLIVHVYRRWKYETVYGSKKMCDLDWVYVARYKYVMWPSEPVNTMSNL